MSTTQNTQPELRGPLVTLRDPRESDVDPLTAVLAEPEVAVWWVGYTPERVREELVEHPETTRIIEVEGQTVGALIVLRGDDPEYPTTVMHIFLSTAFRGRRIGEGGARTRDPARVLGGDHPHHARSQREERGRDPQLRAPGLPAHRHPPRLPGTTGRHARRRALHGSHAQRFPGRAAAPAALAGR